MEKNTFIEILEQFWPRNKAKGLYAQTALVHDINSGVFGPDAKDKFIAGCWFLSPNEPDFYKFRFSFFVHPKIGKGGDENLGPKEVLTDNYRPFHAVTEFLSNAGVGVVYVRAITSDGNLPLKTIKEKDYSGIIWNFYNFTNSNFKPRNPLEFFSGWAGARGRASHGNEWEGKIRENMLKLDSGVLTDLLLNELFYSAFLKSTLRKPFKDPYDIDSFLVSISQKHVFPVEIKEKYPAESREGLFFGIDAGRIMMLLRICLPNDSNAIYIIREVNEGGDFVGWKYTTLSDIVMTASWNLQAGGPGMGGQNTQTIRLPYECFKDLNADALTEDRLREIGNLPKDAKTLAHEFGTGLVTRFDT